MPSETLLPPFDDLDKVQDYDQDFKNDKNQVNYGRPLWSLAQAHSSLVSQRGTFLAAYGIDRFSYAALFVVLDPCDN